MNDIGGYEMPKAPAAVEFANFTGDIVRDVLDEPRIVGPNASGREFLIPVTAEYNQDRDQTRVGYRYATVTDRIEALERAVDVPAAFGGAW